MVICGLKAKAGMMSGNLHESNQNVSVKTKEINLMTQWKEAIARKDVNAAIETKMKVTNLSLTHRQAFKALDCGFPEEDNVRAHCSMTEIKKCYMAHQVLIAKFAEDFKIC